ncbi:alanine dehydrogenase [Mycoplasma yeatsii]|uniref:Alanine dehydrogenase n=1 Tax=Mycoplasma yeatsii TaxID=51365 RepID=A0ABU0NEK1_9MOLU|nr:alanine dehydrogenase [Mycoplasma yeatsii]
MKIGLPKEVKQNENRVGITPSGVVELVRHGHEVLVESGAGVGSGFADEEYQKAGAKITTNVEEVWK